ncbi:MAG: AgmX/PglI C-terminal domain-containing protein [Deltaproteobacteria bacterium]
MAGAKVPLTFRIFKGDQLVREEKLSLSVIKLGKVPSAHLKLDDETVSRMHAIIEVNGPGDVSIIDLGSTKGTFVNGQKVNKAKLQSGDTIVVGETKIELTIGQPGDESADEPTRVQPAAVQDIVASTPRPAQPPAMQPSFAPPPPAFASAPPQRPQPAAAAPPAALAATMAPQPVAVRPPPGHVNAGPALYGTATAPVAGFQQAMAGEADDVGGARAVEVAAMLGDSVVGVKHCIDPKGGKVQSTTWALFAIGAVSLIAFVFAFYTAVDNAAYNKGRYDYETQVLKKPGYSVRPRVLSSTFDFIAFGGLLAAIVTMTSAVARMRKEKESPWVRIGTAPGVEFPVEGAPSPDFALVEPHGDDFAFNFAHGMEGEMIVGGQSTSLAELAQQGRTTISPIPANAKIRVRTGKTTFLVSSVPRPRRHAAPLMQWETPFLMSLGGTAAAFAIIMLLLFQIPIDDSSANIDLASLEDTSTRTNSASQDDPPPPPPEDQPDDGKDESGGTGTAMALDEGKMGKKDSDRAEGQYKMQKNQEDPQLARQQAIEQARTAGILGSTALVQGGAFASLTGTGDISSGFDDTNIYGGLLGNEAGEMNGGFGFGRSGFGPGGGGTGWGTIGTGRYGTIGHGSGTGTGYGVGGGRGGMRGRTSAVPTVSIGQPNSQGDLDKAIIRRYIKRNIQKIQYCYEKQLLAKPGLAGTVSTQFFISPNGNVTASNGSGVDPEVANCVADVIHGIEFPKPKGGGGVQVNYPFTFRPAGQ